MRDRFRPGVTAARNGQIPMQNYGAEEDHRQAGELLHGPLWFVSIRPSDPLAKRQLGFQRSRLWTFHSFCATVLIPGWECWRLHPRPSASRAVHTGTFLVLPEQSTGVRKADVMILANVLVHAV